jgi:hypothetical protein
MFKSLVMANPFSCPITGYIKGQVAQQFNKLMLWYRKPYNTRLAILAIVVVVAIMVVSSSAMAQTSGVYGGSSGRTVKELSDNIINYVFNELRIPVVAVGVIVAGYQWFSSNPQGQRNAALTGGGILCYLMGPYLINVIVKTFGGL